MTDKKKLVELIIKSGEICYSHTAEELASHLIANGVTAQDRLEEKQATSDKTSEWISVKDRLPTPYMPVLVCKQPLGGQQPFMTVDYITIGYGETKIWVGDIGTWKNEVTHWMPLPQPPKEVSDNGC